MSLLSRRAACCGGSVHGHDHDSSSTTSPTVATLSGYEYLGCYEDEDIRLLSAAVHLHPEMSVEKCAYYCGGFTNSDLYTKYLGVEASGWCFCGDEPARDLDSIKREGCSLSCLDLSKNELCGGLWAIQVYSVSSGFTPSDAFPRPTSASSTAASSTSGVKTDTTAASASSDSPSSTSQNTSAVIGVAVVAGLLGMALLCIFILWCRRKRENRLQPTPEAPPTFYIKREPRDAADAQPTEVQSHPFRAELEDAQVSQLH